MALKKLVACLPVMCCVVFTPRSWPGCRYVPSPEWQAAFCRRLEGLLPRLQPVQLADTLWAVAELGLRGVPPGLALRLAEGTTRSLATVTGGGLAAALYAAARLRLPLDPATLHAFVKELELLMSELDAVGLAQVCICGCG